ncbi:MAG: hypothetical protein ACRDIZ_02285 [Actinomycetota bacterium]
MPANSTSKSARRSLGDPAHPDLLDTGLAELDLFVIPGWLAGLAAGAVVLGWLYERAESSLLLVALFHGFLNMSSATVATEGIPAAVVSMLVILWAIALLRREASHPRSTDAPSG